MKALLHCPSRGTEWINEYFPGIVPYLLKIGNKPYLEFLIDFCVLNKVTAIKIISDESTFDLEEALGNGERWGIELSYGVCAPDIRPADLPSHYAKALDGDALLLTSGMIWLNYNTRDFQLRRPDAGECWKFGEKVWMLGEHSDLLKLPEAVMQDFGADGIGAAALSNLQDFYRWSMALVNGAAANYSMPSYSSTPDVYIGQNVSIARTAEVTPPVLLGNTVQLGEAVQIGPGAIIGDNSFIDDDTTILHSVIMGNSYVGCHLEIVNKIVYQNMIINPKTGLKLDIIDDFMLTSIEDETVRRRCSYLQRLLALVVFLLMLPAFLLLRPWLKIRWKVVECYLSADRKRSIRLKLYIHPGDSFSSRWFRRLSLDRFHLLGLAIRGELRFIGSRILPVNAESERLLHQFPDYAPGLFSYSEMLGHDEDMLQIEMDELYYIYHASFALNWEILRRTLLRNLFKER